MTFRSSAVILRELPKSSIVIVAMGEPPSSNFRDPSS